MKLTQVLRHQHIGHYFRKYWKTQGRRIVRDSGSLQAVAEKGLEFEDVLDFLKEKRDKIEVPLRGYKPKEIQFDESHPDYHEESCFTYGDHSVLLEGLKQAQILTNTVLLEPDSLPLNKLFVEQESPIQDKLVKRCIRSSLLFDATQEKLPKRHDPTREAWIFPRDYGITEKRGNYLLVNRLLQLCSSFSPQLLGQRTVIDSGKFILPSTLPSGHNVLFSVTGDAVVVANRHPSTGSVEKITDLELPDISPLAPSVSLESTKIYKFEPFFPVNSDSSLNKIHTVMFHYNKSQVRNIFESPVTTDQILGRSLAQSWIFAMSQALQDGKKDLSDPITVQAVQTNGQFFHFSVLKLTSTSVDPSTTPNMFWSFPVMNIFEECSYIRGVPTLEGYNPKVFKTLLAFYNNC